MEWLTGPVGDAPMSQSSNIIKHNKIVVSESDHDHSEHEHEHEPDHEPDDSACYSGTAPNGYDNSTQASPIIGSFSRAHMTLESPNSDNNYLNSPSSQERKSKKKSMGNLLFKRKTHDNHKNRK